MVNYSSKVWTERPTEVTIVLAVTM